MSRRRTAANTGEAGAIYRVACFAGLPAPTGIAQGNGSADASALGGAQQVRLDILAPLAQ